MQKPPASDAGVTGRRIGCWVGRFPASDRLVAELLVRLGLELLSVPKPAHTVGEKAGDQLQDPTDPHFCVQD